MGGTRDLHRLGVLLSISVWVLLNFDTCIYVCVCVCVSDAGRPLDSAGHTMGMLAPFHSVIQIHTPSSSQSNS